MAEYQYNNVSLYNKVNQYRRCHGLNTFNTTAAKTCFVCNLVSADVHTGYVFYRPLVIIAIICVMAHMRFRVSS